jgi:hypothetical protein
MQPLNVSLSMLDWSDAMGAEDMFMVTGVEEGEEGA